MKEEKSTNTQDSMLKLINVAAFNLVLRKNKVSLESEIRKKKEDIKHTREFLEIVPKKAAELEPELMETERSVGESSGQFILLKEQKAALKKEIERLREIERKSALLQQRRAEVRALRKVVSELQDRYDRISPEYRVKLSKREELDEELRVRRSLVQKLKDENASLHDKHELLVSRISGLDFSGYLDDLGRKIGELDNRLKDISKLETIESEPAFLMSYLDCSRKVNILHASFDEPVPDDLKALAQFNKIKDAGAVSQMRAGVGGMANKFISLLRGRIHELEKRKAELDVEVETETLSGNMARLKADIARVDDALRQEQEFMQSYKRHEKELENERAAKEAELEHTKKEAQRAPLEKEINRKLAESIESANEYLMDICKRQNVIVNEYKRAFDKAAMVIEEAIK